MKLEQIKVFLELARELHFWRTAEKMFITQSALSRQIQALETELGFALFVRNKRTVVLTAAGKYMRDEWQRLLEEINNVHRKARQISDGKIGTIRIGHPGSIAYSFLPDLLAETAAKFPDLSFELHEVSAAELDYALLSYKIDIGFSRDQPESEQLSSELLRRDHFGLFVPDEHWLHSETFDGLKHFDKERFILPSMRDGSDYTEALKAIFVAYDFNPNTYIQSEFGSTILGLVARGLGVTIMPAAYALQLPAGVRYIELPHETSLFAVWRRDDEYAVLQNMLAVLRALSINEP